MSRFEYRPFRCRLGWDGGDYYLEAMVEKEWIKANNLGDEGWELVGFWPDAEPYKNSFDEQQSPLIKMAIFKRIVG